MDHLSKQKAMRGVAWTSVANWGCLLLGFCISTTLARLLSPQAYGQVALAWVYIGFIQIFVTQGFGIAIIQRKDLEEEHLDSAFWIAIATALVFCLLSFLLAGEVSHFFKEPRIAPVIRCLCLTMLFSALSSVQTAILTRDLNFRPLAFLSLAATTVSGIVGVVMAFLGFGVWSLVGQQLTNAILACFLLWIAVPWRPRFLVSMRHLRDLYGLSLNLTGNDILWFFSQKSDQTIVGFGFGATGLGPYSLASKLTNLLHGMIVGPLQGVALPAFSKLQSKPNEFESALHKFCEMSSFLGFPIFAGLGLVAPELVPLLFGPKWNTAIPILQVLCFYSALRVAVAYVFPVTVAKGRSGLNLLMNILLSILTVGGCLIAVRWSPKAVALSIGISMLVYALVFLDVARRFLAIRALPLLRSYLYPALCSLVMLATVSLERSLTPRDLPVIGGLAINVCSGVFAYLATAYVVRRSLLKSIVEIVRTTFFSSKPIRSSACTSIDIRAEKTTVEAVEI
jgi:PST family polysaccharide transporter